MKLKQVLNTKNKINDKINSIIDFHAVWEHNHQTKACRLIYMEKGKKQSGLTAADKQWIADLVVTSIQTAVKPINDRLTIIENRLEAIEKCPTIKKELK